MARQIARPGSVRGRSLVSSGGAIGKAGSKFKIEVFDYTLGGRCQLEPTTAPGDEGHNSSENEPVHFISLRGWMVSDQAIGLANLGNSSGTVELYMNRKRKVSGTLKVSNYLIHVKEGRNTAGVSFVGEWQDGAPTEAATS